MAEIHNLNQFINTLKDFKWLEDFNVSGTDIDWIREKKGKIICLEGKRIKDKKIKIKYAQYQMMRMVVKDRGLAFFVGMYENSDKVYVICTDDIPNKNFYRDDFGELSKQIDINTINPIFKSEFALQIKAHFKRWGVN